LANIVGRLPLAIDQAASFMKLGYSVEDLLELHRGDDRLKVSQKSRFLSKSWVIFEQVSTTNIFIIVQDTRMGESIVYLRREIRCCDI
jgi:hypothetical protein